MVLLLVFFAGAMVGATIGILALALVAHAEKPQDG